MSLTKKKMVREIGRRTRLRNRDIQLVIENLIQIWTEELVIGGRIEIENFMVLACYQRYRNDLSESNLKQTTSARKIRLTLSKRIRERLHE